MVARHYVDTDVDCVFIEHFGAFEVGDGPASLWDILADPAFRPGMKFFRDASRTVLPGAFGYAYFVCTKKHSMGEIEERIGATDMAWLVGSARDFAAIHQLSVCTRLAPKGLQRRPFRTIDSAFDWLGLAPDYPIRFPAAPCNPSETGARRGVSLGAEPDLYWQAP